MNRDTARTIRDRAARKAAKSPTLEQIGHSQPHAFFVHHEGKHKKNPHYVPARKRK